MFDEAGPEEALLEGLGVGPPLAVLTLKGLTSFSFSVFCATFFFLSAFFPSAKTLSSWSSISLNSASSSSSFGSSSSSESAATVPPQKKQTREAN